MNLVFANDTDPPVATRPVFKRASSGGKLAPVLWSRGGGRNPSVLRSASGVELNFSCIACAVLMDHGRLRWKDLKVAFRAHFAVSCAQVVTVFSGS